MADVLKFSIIFIFAGFILGLLPFIIKSTYLIHFLLVLYIYIILAEGWNLMGGYCGLVVLHHATFFGLGAYACAALLLANISPIIGIIAGGAVSSIFAFVSSPPLLRLSKTYFAAVTLVSSEIFKTVFINIKGLGGASGLVLPKFPEYSLIYCYILGVFLLIICLFTAFIIVKSRIGLAFVCIRENEIAAASIGISTLHFKLLALCIGGFMAGVAGALYTLYFLYVLPHSIFSLAWTGAGAFSCLIGGGGTFLGPIIGASVYFLASQVFLGFGEINLLITGLTIVVVVLFFPRGILGFLRK